MDSVKGSESEYNDNQELASSFVLLHRNTNETILRIPRLNSLCSKSVKPLAANGKLSLGVVTNGFELSDVHLQKREMPS